MRTPMRTAAPALLAAALSAPAWAQESARDPAADADCQELETLIENQEAFLEASVAPVMRVCFAGPVGRPDCRRLTLARRAAEKDLFLLRELQDESCPDPGADGEPPAEDEPEPDAEDGPDSEEDLERP